MNAIAFLLHKAVETDTYLIAYCWFHYGGRQWKIPDFFGNQVWWCKMTNVNKLFSSSRLWVNFFVTFWIKCEFILQQLYNLSLLSKMSTFTVIIICKLGLWDSFPGKTLKPKKFGWCLERESISEKYTNSIVPLLIKIKFWELIIYLFIEKLLQE